MLGATTREVAPDALLGVHSAKVVFRYNGGTPPPEMRAAATQRGLARVDSMLSRYFVKMGAEQGLLALASTIRFEDVHVLTREEIVRFGIDRRELVETPWTFENVGRSVVHKTVIRKNDGDKSYRTLQWRLICFNTNQFELDFQRPRAMSSVLPSVAVPGGSTKPQYLMSASHVRVSEIVGLRSPGHADDESFDPRACRTAGIGPDRGVANARRGGASRRLRNSPAKASRPRSTACWRPVRPRRRSPPARGTHREIAKVGSFFPHACALHAPAWKLPAPPTASRPPP